MYGNLCLSFSPSLPTSRFPFLPVLPSLSLPPVLSLSRAFLYTPNAYTFCQGLDKLTKLKLLSVQSNRLVKIEGLEALVKLEELYISHNGIKRLEGLDTLVNLVTLDVANNFVKRIESVSHLTKLEEFWVSQVMLIYIFVDVTTVHCASCMLFLSDDRIVQLDSSYVYAGYD